MWFLSQKNMKKEFPVLITERLILSRPVEGDMQHIVHYLDSDKVYSENTANIPYPYCWWDWRAYNVLSARRCYVAFCAIRI